ncbi:bile acid:sodium symporter family protein [Chelativorans sp. AA-79]|uniref:bile acid:sodium symporter family protein n=1 Tax=Chelativorans sp. AA-79 TaxID=3028735 RepID=UPI0023F78826|nr:bile acid:sodium symporter family protein [Chelativorans sp. AA-79]WEX07284.1 bile acid:sodium symporter family protein [Chelativorans sp. AA-79]
MQSSAVLSIGLPVALFIIMLGLGLSLTPQNFTQVLAKPKPVVIGVLCQMVVMPLLFLPLVYWSELPPAISVGMMLLAASPSATSASLYTYLARGDVALSLTLAAATSLLALVSLPLIGNLAMELFYGGAAAVTVEIKHILQIFVIAIVPAAIGAFIHGRRPALAARLERPVKLLATLFIAAIVVIALIGNWGLLMEWGPVIGATTLAFNLMSFAVGYLAPRMMGIERQRTIAVAMATGIHNAALAITIALSEYMLDNPEMAIPPALYGLTAYITGAIFVWLLNRRPVSPLPSEG